MFNLERLHTLYDAIDTQISQRYTIHSQYYQMAGGTDVMLIRGNLIILTVYCVTLANLRINRDVLSSDTCDDASSIATTCAMCSYIRSPQPLIKKMPQFAIIGFRPPVLRVYYSPTGLVPVPRPAARCRAVACQSSRAAAAPGRRTAAPSRRTAAAAERSTCVPAGGDNNDVVNV